MTSSDGETNGGVVPCNRRTRYWRANMKLLLGLLGVWFLFGCVFSIFLVEWLNQFRLGGFPMGFWMAQQGTILAFIVLILVYVLRMKQLDQAYHRERSQAEGSEGSDR